jgi:hypothetical protein
MPYRDNTVSIKPPTCSQRPVRRLIAVGDGIDRDFLGNESSRSEVSGATSSETEGPGAGCDESH